MTPNAAVGLSSGGQPGAAPSSERFNIAQYLPAMAASAPQRPAVICTHKPDSRGRTSLTFSEMNAESDAIARGLASIGVTPGTRTLLMVRPGLDFVTLTFALFKCAAVPVLIDPGMGGKNLLNCVRRSKPQAMVAVPLAHAMKTVFGGDAFDDVKASVTVGKRWFWGGVTLDHVRRRGESSQAFESPPTTRESDAAILFTTGSTGIPKGVLYKHGMFDAQVAAIRAEYGIAPGEIDLPAFPLFALFSTALGTTCVIPEMDPTRPAKCNPEKIVRALQEHRVTYTFGSPSIWKRVGPYCLEKGITLPHLKRILMAGAPVRGSVLEPFQKILGEGGDTFIPYGATEALPMASIRGSEVLRETWMQTRQGKGYCVGRPLPGVTIRVIKDAEHKDGICAWDESLVQPNGEIGEIVVSAPMVTHEYFAMPEQTRAAKIYDNANGRVWHRMGDMGYIDAQGRLWFCGRKAHRVITKETTLHSVCVEAIFESGFESAMRDGITVRTALVGIGTPGAQTAAIVAELDATAQRALDAAKFESWWKSHALSKDIRHVLHYTSPFPVDIRHNAKINREELAVWAGSRVKSFGL